MIEQNLIDCHKEDKMLANIRELKPSGMAQGNSFDLVSQKPFRPSGQELSEANSSRIAPKSENGWGWREIAQMTPDEIRCLPTKARIEIVYQWSDLLPQPDVRKRLHYLDCHTLEQLVYLVQQVCRHRQQRTPAGVFVTACSLQLLPYWNRHPLKAK